MLKRTAKFLGKIMGPSLDEHAVFALIFQVTNRCNSRCAMCFKWKELNKNAAEELALPEIERLTKEMGDVPSVTLCGGEPSLRQDLPEICRLFEKNCKTAFISIPTNCLLPNQILRIAGRALQRTSTAKIAVGLSIDGVGRLHDRIRGVKGNFKRVLQTYSALAELDEPRLEINANTTVSRLNVGQIPEILWFVEKEMPRVKQHTFEVIRGTFDKSRIAPPTLSQYRNIIRCEKNPILKYYHFKALETIEKNRQVVPCKAGPHTPVIDAFGNVYACEGLPTVGNIRQSHYADAWRSQEWEKQQISIKAGACSCTHICFLLPSIYMNKVELANLLVYRALAKAGIVS